ncbi:unnamed protein product [Musa hybrid cultivar]
MTFRGTTSITFSGVWASTRGRSSKRRGICWCPTTWWECRAPSTAGFSHVPQGLDTERGASLNNTNIYITETSPPEVVKAYQRQFQRDLSEFLRCRYAELSYEGRLVISFGGRKKEDKLVTFNLPRYAPSMEEVKAVIHGDGLFDEEDTQVFEANWDAFDDSDDDSAAFDSDLSGKNVPQGLDTEQGVSLNKKKVYIAETSPPECHKSIYQDQFQRDQLEICS